MKAPTPQAPEQREPGPRGNDAIGRFLVDQFVKEGEAMVAAFCRPEFNTLHGLAIPDVAPDYCEPTQQAGTK